MTGDRFAPARHIFDGCGSAGCAVRRCAAPWLHGLALALWLLPSSALGSAVAATPYVPVPPVTLAAAWSSYHGNVSNNALFAEPGRAPVRWRSAAVQDQAFAMSIAGDAVYVAGAGNTHAIYALNRANGQVVWAQILNNIIMTQPIVAAGRVFVGAGNNYMQQDPVRDWTTVIRGTEGNAVYALDAASGTMLWMLPLEGEAMPTPTYIDGLLYVVTGERRFLAIDAGTGRIVWSLRLPSYVSMSSPVRDGNLLLFGGAHPYAEYAVDIAARAIAWRHAFVPGAGLVVTGAVDDCSGAVSRHVLFCTATVSKKGVALSGGSPVRQIAFALNTATGATVWQRDEGAGVLPNSFAAGVPTVRDGVVYLPTPVSHGLEARDASTGRLLWRAVLDAVSRSAPVVDGTVLFTADDAGTVYQFDAPSGRLRHRMRIGGGVSNVGVVLDSGTLYVPNTLGGVVDAIPQGMFTGAGTVDIMPPFGPLTTLTGASPCG